MGRPRFDDFDLRTDRNHRRALRAGGLGVTDLSAAFPPQWLPSRKPSRGGGLAPWLLWLVREFGNVADLYREFPQAIAAAAFAAVVVVGSTIENFNSYIENMWDEEREKEWAVTANWYTYLARTFDHEPVGYTYLSRMFTTLYFELGMAWATAIAALGVMTMIATSPVVGASNLIGV